MFKFLKEGKLWVNFKDFICFVFIFQIYWLGVEGNFFGWGVFWVVGGGGYCWGCEFGFW